MKISSDSSNSGESTRHVSASKDTPAKKEQKFEGFDVLRAIFSIAIVAYKTKVFYIPEMLIPSAFSYFLSTYLLSGMVGALAVPVFLQISLFLFYDKSRNLGLGYFVHKRLPRILSLYLFWVVSITVFDVLFVGKFEAVRGVASSPKAFLEFIVSGNSTPYFFFFSLIFVTVLAEILTLWFSKLREISTKIYISYYLLFGSCTLLFAFSTIEPFVNHVGIQSSPLNTLNNLANWDYNPLNFLPYVFTAAIAAQEQNEGKLAEMTRWLKLKLVSLLVLALIFFALESTLTSKGLLIQVDQAPLDHYMRLSLVFGSWLLFYLALLSKYQVPALIKFISKCSLGIYGFHVFLTFKGHFSLEYLPTVKGIFQADSILGVTITFLVTLIGSIVLTLVFKRVVWLRKFV